VFIGDSAIMPVITDANNGNNVFVIGWRLAEILVSEVGVDALIKKKQK